KDRKFSDSKNKDRNFSDYKNKERSYSDSKNKDRDSAYSNDRKPFPKNNFKKDKFSKEGKNFQKSR
ncbi:MAG: hypothetical protein KDK36_07110, partial [Leptospiraceae bacterium]|nr:hypothetical protein [Leptospiraceae bacterium]